MNNKYAQSGEGSPAQEQDEARAATVKECVSKAIETLEAMERVSAPMLQGLLSHGLESLRTGLQRELEQDPELGRDYEDIAVRALGEVDLDSFLLSNKSLADITSPELDHEIGLQLIEEAGVYLRLRCSTAEDLRRYSEQLCLSTQQSVTLQGRPGWQSLGAVLSDTRYGDAEDSMDPRPAADYALLFEQARNATPSRLNDEQRVELYRSDERNWKTLGSCAGMDPKIFYPERGASTREAKETCRSCIVSDICRNEAMNGGEKFGIWGGMTERERGREQRSLMRKRQAVSLKPQIDNQGGSDGKEGITSVREEAVWISREERRILRRHDLQPRPRLTIELGPGELSGVYGLRVVDADTEEVLSNYALAPHIGSKREQLTSQERSLARAVAIKSFFELLSEQGCASILPIAEIKKRTRGHGLPHELTAWAENNFSRFFDHASELVDIGGGSIIEKSGRKNVGGRSVLAEVGLEQVSVSLED